MSPEPSLDYPVGFSDLLQYLSAEDMPIAEHGAEVCAGAVLFAVDHLHPRTMAVLADQIVGRTSSEPLNPALCEVASSRDPDRDPEIRSAFRSFLDGAGLLRSHEEGWAVLARVGARHVRAIVGRIAAGTLDPIEGALEIETCFERYVPESDRTGARRHADRPWPSAGLAPFVVFLRVSEDLYEAGHNVNAWNHRLSHAPSNVLSPAEKAAALSDLRARYVRLARECLKP